MSVVHSTWSYLVSAGNSIRWASVNQRALIAQRLARDDVSSLVMLLPDYSGPDALRKFRFRPRKLHFVGDLDLCRQVFRESGEVMDAGSGYAFLKPYLGEESVFVLDDEEHIETRRAILRKIKKYLSFEEDEVSFFDYSIDEIIREGEYPILDSIQAISASFILRSVFGEQGTALSRQIVDAAVEASSLASGGKLLFPQIQHYFRRFGSALEVRKKRAMLRRFILDHIQERTEEAAGPKQFRWAWSDMDTRKLVDNYLTLYIAGFETTGAAIAWCLLELCYDRDAQTELRREVMQHLGSDDEFLEYMANDRTLLAATVNETFRLHPPIPFVIREAETAYELASARIEAGDFVVLSIETVHMVEFGDDPEIFRPKRFLEDGAAKRLMTFGGGRKHCPGRAIAIEEARIMVALLLLKFDFEPTRRTYRDVERNRVSAVPKGGLTLRVRKIA